MTKQFTGIDPKRLEPGSLHEVDCIYCLDTGEEPYQDKKYGPCVRSCTNCDKGSHRFWSGLFGGI